MNQPGILPAINYLFRSIFFVICLSLLCLTSAGVLADEIANARINIGLKLFRAILAADLQIKTKQNKDGELPLLIIYKKDPFFGEIFAQNLMQLGKINGRSTIKKIPVKVSYLSYQSFLTMQHKQHERPAGIFLVEKMSRSELAPITSYGIKNKLIIYSPFNGDEKKKITASLSIGARVSLVINMKTLKESDIHIKPFFLEVTQKYEP